MQECTVSWGNLARIRPDVLEETVLLSQTVQRVVSLTLGTDETGKGVGVVVTRDDVALLVQLSNVDLNSGMVLRLDQTVSGRALAGSEKLDVDALVVLHCDEVDGLVTGGLR